MAKKKANVDRLPSGKYRVRQMVEGKTYTVLFKHLPTQKEIRDAIDLKILNDTKDENVKSFTFRQAADEYISLKDNVLSDATIREYVRMCDRLPEWFSDMQLSDINQIVMQKLVNELAETLSPKTVKDRHGFCAGVIRLFNPSMVFSTILPKNRLKSDVESDIYIPTHDEVKIILKESRKTMFYIPLQLACYGLRREEICALETTDLTHSKEGYFVTVDKALIQNKDKEWIISDTKTTDSSRLVGIDHALAKQIKELPEGRVYKGSPQSIANYLKRTQKKLGIKPFKLHAFRHYFCSTLSENADLSESTILAMGGWKQNSDVMKKVYRHSNISEKRKELQNAVDVLKKARS